jgi:murein DD-endopeptidase MepM/ murein hydrolase activator NlpD
MHRHALLYTTFLVALLAIPLTAQAKDAPPPPDLYQVHTEAGVELFRAGKFSAALTEFKEARRVAKGWHRRTERYPKSLFNTARTYAAVQNYKKAGQDVSLARLAAKKNVEEDLLLGAYIEVLAGQIAIETGKTDAAINSMNLAIPVLSEGLESDTLSAPLCDAANEVGFALFISDELDGAGEFYAEAEECYQALGLIQDVQRSALINRQQRLLRAQGKDEEADAVERLGSMGEAPADFGITLLTSREATLAEASAYADQWIAERHEDPELFNTEQIIVDLSALMGSEPTESKIKRFLDQQLTLQSYSPFPVDSDHDSTYAYALPYDETMPLMIGQAFGGSRTHNTPGNYHAVDWMMTIGTPVLAARDGVVANVIKGHTDHCYDAANLESCYSVFGNSVSVLHDDGSFAIYIHLDSSENGVLVERGQEIKRKQLLGHSGYTGVTSTPQLHFAVMKRHSSGNLVTVPYVFQNGNEKEYVPEKGDLPGSPPAVTANTLLYIGDQRVESGSTPEPTYTLKNGDSIQLRVELQRTDGSIEDITNSPHTRFVAVNPARLNVSDGGLVTATPMPNFVDGMSEYEGEPHSALGIPLLSVYYNDKDKSDFSWANLVLEIDYEGKDVIRVP